MFLAASSLDPASASDAQGASMPAPASLVLLPPPEDLAPLVEYVWQLTLAGDAASRSVWRVVVDGYVDLAVRIPLGDVPDGRIAREIARARLEQATRFAAMHGCAATPSSAGVQVGQLLRVLAVEGVLGAVRRLVAHAESARRSGVAPDPRRLTSRTPRAAGHEHADVRRVAHALGTRVAHPFKRRRGRRG